MKASQPDPQELSVERTLLEAELEHYRECPTADPGIRAAALLLDLILFSLASSGIRHFGETLQTSWEAWAPVSPSIQLGMAYLLWLINSAAFFGYFIWSVVRFGGSPAKILMGLRVMDYASGHRLGYGRTLIREIVFKPLGVLFLLDLVFAAFRKDRRVFHDWITRSVVKRVRGDTP